MKNESGPRPVFKNKFCASFGLEGGATVAFAGGNNRALHEHVPNLRKFLGVAKAGLLGQIADDSANFCQVVGSSHANSAVRVRFEKYVDERAAFERLEAKPSTG